MQFIMYSPLYKYFCIEVFFCSKGTLLTHEPKILHADITYAFSNHGSAQTIFLQLNVILKLYVSKMYSPLYKYFCIEVF